MQAAPPDFMPERRTIAAARSKSSTFTSPCPTC